MNIVIVLLQNSSSDTLWKILMLLEYIFNVIDYFCLLNLSEAPSSSLP